MCVEIHSNANKNTLRVGNSKYVCKCKEEEEEENPTERKEQKAMTGGVMTIYGYDDWCSRRVKAYSLISGSAHVDGLTRAKGRETEG